MLSFFFFFFFFNDTAPTEIYTLSLHDALPIFRSAASTPGAIDLKMGSSRSTAASGPPIDRKSTRLNSSHVEISYAVFCLKKKKKKNKKHKRRHNTTTTTMNARDSNRSGSTRNR